MAQAATTTYHLKLYSCCDRQNYVTKSCVKMPTRLFFMYHSVPVAEKMPSQISALL